MSEKPLIAFHTPAHESIKIGSLVWHYHHNLCRLQGPFHVVEIRHLGHGDNSYKKWILFDTCKDLYYPALWNNLRVPKEYT